MGHIFPLEIQDFLFIFRILTFHKVVFPLH